MVNIGIIATSRSDRRVTLNVESEAFLDAGGFAG